jgi:protein gp37
MANDSKIEWTDSTWNPTTGCTKVSQGCKNCYAERLSKRLMAMGQENYRDGFKLTLHETMLSIPLKWKKPKRIFVDSMSDLFHEDVPDDFIFKVFSVMEKASWHIFQILTKRSHRLLSLNKYLKWPSNVWMGVSIEDQDNANRMIDLTACGAKIKFLSLEPLLGPVVFKTLEEINWVIVGGESGPNCRKMEKEWVITIRDQCIKNKTPFFFKQWGGSNKKLNGRMLEQRTWDQFPNNFKQESFF